MTHRIVIVGGGAGGLELATRLGRKFGKRNQAHVTLVDANLTHIWKPLMHEIAAGSLNSSADELNYVAQAKWNHFEFQLGRLTGLDRANKRIRLAPITDEQGKEVLAERTMPYDTLVISIGSKTNDFGTPGAAEHCLFLDTRAQAERFHQQLLNQYLHAQASSETAAPIDIAIVGAGATGVELAAELRNTAQQLVSYGLNRIRPEDLRITIIEAGPRVLPALPERIGEPVAQQLQKLGVRLITGAAVSSITEDGLTTKSGEFIPAKLKVWAAGIRAPEFLANMDGLESNRINQLVVRPTLQTTQDDDIFAFDDCAACPMSGEDNRNVPPRAQAAHQQASLLVKSITARLKGEALPEYHYKDYGSLISLSRYSAVGNLMGNLTGNVMLEGWLARMFYVSLYRLHQRALYGNFRTLLLIISDHLGHTLKPRLKLH